MVKATGFKFGTLIDQVTTNQKTGIYPYNRRGLSHVILYKYEQLFHWK